MKILLLEYGLIASNLKKKVCLLLIWKIHGYFVFIVSE